MLALPIQRLNFLPVPGQLGQSAGLVVALPMLTGMTAEQGKDCVKHGNSHVQNVRLKDTLHLPAASVQVVVLGDTVIPHRIAAFRLLAAGSLKRTVLLIVLWRPTPTQLPMCLISCAQQQ